MALEPKDLETLKKLADFDEAHTLIATIRGYRRNDVGAGRPITIEVWDMGEGPARYSVRAIDENGRLLARGNPHDNVYAAIRAVHWGDLDKPERDQMR
jgi:hypothetical protein